MARLPGHENRENTLRYLEFAEGLNAAALVQIPSISPEIHSAVWVKMIFVSLHFRWVWSMKPSEYRPSFR